MFLWTKKIIVKLIGEVAEWLKAHAWKACIGGDSIAGSNPALSAIKYTLKGQF